MKLIRYFYGITLSALFSTSIFAYEGALPEFQETQDQQFQRPHARFSNQKLIESYYRIKIFDDIVNAATGQSLSEQVSPPKVRAEKVSPVRAEKVSSTITAALQAPYVYLAEELETLRIPGVVTAFLRSDSPDALEIKKQFEVKCEKYTLGERNPKLPRSEKVNRSNFITEINDEWNQEKRRMLKAKRHLPLAQDLADQFRKAQDLTDELKKTELKKDRASVYDVVKRENAPRSIITPSSYIGPEEVMPSKKRKPSTSSEAWNDISVPQTHALAPKRKWAARSEEWNEQLGPQDPRPSKKRKLDPAPSEEVHKYGRS